MAVVRAALMCGVGFLNNILLIPVVYLSAKGAGLLTFMAHLVYMKSKRTVDVMSDVTKQYNFNAMHDPVVQVGESLAYSCWAGAIFSVFDDEYYAYSPNVGHSGLILLLMTVIGQVMGLVWLWLLRARISLSLRDPAKVLQLIRRLESART